MDRYSNDPHDFAGSEDDSAQRATARDSFFLTASVRFPNSRIEAQVRVRNLSPGGMMADYVGDIGVGDPVRLTIRGIGDIDGQVAWSTEGRIGIAFEEPIDPRKARKPVAPTVKPMMNSKARAVL